LNENKNFEEKLINKEGIINNYDSKININNIKNNKNNNKNNKC
jgi:hypothetical protein